LKNTLFIRLFKNVQMQGPRWFDKLTMTSLRACPELAEGKDEGNEADERFSTACPCSVLKEGPYHVKKYMY